MASEAKEMKYRRRGRVPVLEPRPSESYGQCSGTLDWAAALKDGPTELLRKLDEIWDQITRSCELVGQPPPERHRAMSRCSLAAALVRRAVTAARGRPRAAGPLPLALRRRPNSISAMGAPVATGGRSGGAGRAASADADARRCSSSRSARARTESGSMCF